MKRIILIVVMLAVMLGVANAKWEAISCDICEAEISDKEYDDGVNYLNAGSFLTFANQVEELRIVHSLDLCHDCYIKYSDKLTSQCSLTFKVNLNAYIEAEKDTVAKNRRIKEQNEIKDLKKQVEELNKKIKELINKREATNEENIEETSDKGFVIDVGSERTLTDTE